MSWPDSLTLTETIHCDDARLHDLLKHRVKPDAGSASASYKTIGSEVSAQSGVTFSAAHPWRVKLPTLRHLRALAPYFGPPVSYFTDGDVTQRAMAAEMIRHLRMPSGRVAAGGRRSHACDNSR